MKKDSFERVLHFLIGASWAFIILGALLVFKFFFLLFGLTIALFSVFVFVFFALFFVLVLDFFVTQKKVLHEQQKQTKILEEFFSKEDKEETIKHS